MPPVEAPAAPVDPAAAADQSWAYSNFDDWTAAGADPSTVGTSHDDETEGAESQSVDPLAAQETSPLEAPVDWAEPVGWTTPATVSEPSTELTVGAASTMSDTGPVNESRVVFPDMGSTGGSSGLAGDWADPPSADEPTDEPVAEHDSPSDETDGTDGESADDREVYWSAEIVEGGEPDGVPHADSPMGSAFQLGVAALLSQSDGSVLGVPTSPFHRPPAADEVTDTETDAAGAVAESTEITDTVDSTDGPSAEAATTPPLAPPPSFESGRMRRTSMWQARVDQVVEENNAATDETAQADETVEDETEVEAVDTVSDELEVAEPATPVSMFDAPAPRPPPSPRMHLHPPTRRPRPTLGRFRRPPSHWTPTVRSRRSPGPRCRDATTRPSR